MPTTQSAQFDLHGVVAIRLIDASPQDVATVSRQVGPPTKELHEEPDIQIRFAPRRQLSDLRLVGLNQWGFTEDGFFILQNKKKATQVRLDLSQVGGRCEIVCQSGLPAVPLLMPIVNLRAFAKGFVPLHASAFNYRGRGILVAGWAKGGKTEALLSFAGQGAEYVGDEWILLSEDGQKMLGIPEGIRLWDWHLQYLPHLNGAVSLEKRWLFRGIRWADALQGRGAGRLLPLRYLRQAMPALRRQLNVTVPPQALFGEPLGPCRAKPDRLFLMMSHDKQSMDVRPVDPDEVAERMAFSVRFEQSPLWDAYLAYRFAFPQAENPLLESLHESQPSRLRKALQGKSAFEVLHPYPCPFPDLFEAMKPFC